MDFYYAKEISGAFGARRRVNPPPPRVQTPPLPLLCSNACLLEGSTASPSKHGGLLLCRYSSNLGLGNMWLLPEPPTFEASSQRSVGVGEGVVCVPGGQARGLAPRHGSQVVAYGSQGCAPLLLGARYCWRSWGLNTVLSP